LAAILAPGVHECAKFLRILADRFKFVGLRERLRETEVIDAWSKIVGDFIAAHSAPFALREGILYVRVLQPALHYELEQISKSEILRKLKQRFGGKTIRDIRFRAG
jgi:predicted nucleic acid-binding Zn ribbon protein